MDTAERWPHEASGSENRSCSGPFFETYRRRMSDGKVRDRTTNYSSSVPWTSLNRPEPSSPHGKEDDHPTSRSVACSALNSLKQPAPLIGLEFVDGRPFWNTNVLSRIAKSPGIAMLRLPPACGVGTNSCDRPSKLTRVYALKLSATLGIKFVQLQRTFPSFNDPRSFLGALWNTRSR